MIEAELVLGGLEAIFYRPAVTFDGDERLDVGALWASGREVGQIAVADIASDQETPGADA